MSRANPEKLELTAPLSFWGGFDIETGTIVDPSHPQCGEILTGKIVLMEGSRGSTNSPGALLESIRRGTGPARFVLRKPDAVILVVSHLARLLYDIDVPVSVETRSSDPR
jgi:predicted aconitase with swiveling domain